MQVSASRLALLHLQRIALTIRRIKRQRWLQVVDRKNKLEVFFWLVACFFGFFAGLLRQHGHVERLVGRLVGFGSCATDRRKIGFGRAEVRDCFELVWKPDFWVFESFAYELFFSVFWIFLPCSCLLFYKYLYFIIFLLFKNT